MAESNVAPDLLALCDRIEALQRNELEWWEHLTDASKHWVNGELIALLRRALDAGLIAAARRGVEADRNPDAVSALAEEGAKR